MRPFYNFAFFTKTHSRNSIDINSTGTLQYNNNAAVFCTAVPSARVIELRLLSPGGRTGRRRPGDAVADDPVDQI